MPTLSATVFRWAPAGAAPIARIVEVSSTRRVGGLLRFSGAGSDGEGLTYAWELVDSPYRSHAELRQEGGDGAEAILLPQEAGFYTVRLVVTDTLDRTSSADLRVEAARGVAPPSAAEVPDGSWGYAIAGSFFREYLGSGGEVLPTLWSGMMQVVGTYLLRALATERLLRPSLLQAAAPYAWVPVRPAATLPIQECWASPSQAGEDALTGIPLSRLRVAALSVGEVVVLAGNVTAAAVGTDITIRSGAAAGTYRVQRLNADGSGYLLSPATPLPEVPTRYATSTLRTLRGSPTVEDLGGGADFVAAGVLPGDLLRIQADSEGLYLVEEVSTTSLRVTPTPQTTRTRRTGEVLPGTAATLEVGDVGGTHVVYIPESSLDASPLQPPPMSGAATLVAPQEILVSAAHVLPELCGASMSVALPGGVWLEVPLVAVNESGTGYLTAVPLPGPFPQRSRYRVSPRMGAASRVFVLDGQAYPIQGLRPATELPPAEDGGPGPCWAVDLGGPGVPWGLEGMSWRLDSVLIAPAGTDDLREMGVSPGDTLLVEVVREGTELRALLPARVTGVLSDRLSFTPGIPSTPMGAVMAEALRALSIPRASVGVSGEVVFDLLAAEVVRDLTGPVFQARMRAAPLRPGNYYAFGGVRVQVRAVQVIRNLRVPVPEDTVGVPVLQEWIKEPQVYPAAGGGYTLAAPDRTVRRLPSPPVRLYAGEDYHVQHPAVPVRDLTLSAGTAWVATGEVDCLREGVEVGDALEIVSGLVRGAWPILRVEQGRILLQREAFGTDAVVRGVVRRAVRASFLRFTARDGRLPGLLWAPVWLRSTDPEVERVWGTLTGLSVQHLQREAWDAPPYVHLVRGLAYGQVMPCTPAVVEASLACLMGQPVFPHDSRILLLDMEVGRVVVEELSPGTLAPTGRPVVWPVQTGDTLEGPLAVIATNPGTGSTWAVGDVLPAWTPLTRRVRVADEQLAPGWWRGMPDTPGRELARYHGWEVLLDLTAVPAQLLDVAAVWARRISPAWASPHVVGLLPLNDQLLAEDDLTLGLAEELADHPSLSIEAGSALDAQNGSSVVLGRYDSPHLFGTRTLYQGWDLVMEPGGAVSSARGGFRDTPTGDISRWFPSPMVAAPPAEGGPWEERGDDLPRALVREGDVLYVPSGSNAGWYRIMSVPSDTVLEVIQDEELPASLDPATWEARTGAPYQILREEDAWRWSGDLSVTAGEDTVTLAEGAYGLVWEGVAVGDYVLIDIGDDAGAWRVVWVSPDGTAARTERTFTTTATYTSRILREGLRENPLLEGSGGATDGTALVSLGGGLVTGLIRRGDLLIFADGVDAEVAFPIRGVASDSLLLLAYPPTGTETGLPWRIERPGRAATPLGNGGDDLRALTEDPLEVEVYAPRSEVWEGATFLLESTRAYLTPTGDAGDAEDLTAFVEVGDALDIGAMLLSLESITGAFEPVESVEGATSGATAIIIRHPTDDALWAAAVEGTFEEGETITGVASGATATLTSVTHPVALGSREVTSVGDSLGWDADLPALADWPVPAFVWRPAPVWDITGDTAEDTTGADLTAEGVLPGDFLRYAGESYLILVVGVSTLTLNRDTGLAVSGVAAAVWRAM